VAGGRACKSSGGGLGAPPSPRTNCSTCWACASSARPVVLPSSGNAPRTICCGPGEFQTDIGILKNTNIGERYRLQFRGEIYNLFNHTQFFQPDGNITDGTDFGRVKRARDPRLVQFALKFYF